MTVEVLRSFFGWMAVCNIALLCVMTFGILFCRNMIYNLNCRWFDMPKEAVNAVLYAVIAWYKLVNIAFFVMPYLVLRFFI